MALEQSGAYLTPLSMSTGNGKRKTENTGTEDCEIEMYDVRYVLKLLRPATHPIRFRLDYNKCIIICRKSKNTARSVELSECPKVGCE